MAQNMNEAATRALVDEVHHETREQQLRRRATFQLATGNFLGAIINKSRAKKQHRLAEEANQRKMAAHSAADPMNPSHSGVQPPPQHPPQYHPQHPPQKQSRRERRRERKAQAAQPTVIHYTTVQYAAEAVPPPTGTPVYHSAGSYPPTGAYPAGAYPPAGAHPPPPNPAYPPR